MWHYTSHNWICLYPKQNLELNSSVLIFNFFPKVRLYVLLLYKVTIITLINWSDSCCRTDDWQFDKDPNQDWKFAINVVSVCCVVHTVQFNHSYLIIVIGMSVKVKELWLWPMERSKLENVNKSCPKRKQMLYIISFWILPSSLPT